MRRCDACGQPTERNIGDADLNVEARRRIAFLKELRVEDASVELRGGLLIGHLHPDVLQAAGLDWQFGPLHHAARNPGGPTGAE